MSRGRIVIGVAVLGLVVALLWFASRGTPTPGTQGQVVPKKDVAEQAGSVSSPSDSNSKGSNAVIATEKNSAAQNEANSGVAQPSVKETPNQISPANYGAMQPVNSQANSQAAAIAESVKTGDHPERLSVMLETDAPFDAAAFKADPVAYVKNTVNPGLAYQTATPSADVPELKALSNTLAAVAQNTPVKLSLQATPGALVALTSSDGGYFDNKLNNILVLAGKDGVASATYTAGPGTIGKVNIVAGSPQLSAQVRFKVVVEGGAPSAAGK